MTLVMRHCPIAVTIKAMNPRKGAETYGFEIVAATHTFTYQSHESP
jgi:hypothetical protein